MNGPTFHIRSWLVTWMIWAFLNVVRATPGLADETLPEASEVIPRLIERAEWVAKSNSHPRYTFLSHDHFEKFDADGNTLHSEKKLYRVEWKSGLPVKQLIAIEGKNLNAEELANLQAKDEDFQSRFTSMNARDMAHSRQTLVTTQLLSRYQFEVTDRISLRDRPTLVIHFKAKAAPDSGETFQDKILNRLQGTLWIDEAEADTARLSIRLTEPLSLGWLGILGSLSQCNFHLERKRMPEGLWINHSQKLQIQCRRLFTIMRFRKTEKSKDYQIFEIAE